MHEEVDRPPVWALFLTGPLALAGVALAALWPGTAAFWIAPLLVLSFAVTGALIFLTPWDEIPLTRRRIAAVLATALAVGGGVWVLVAPDDRSYLLGGLMTLPLMAVLLARSDGTRGKDMPAAGDPASDLPPFD